MDRGADAWVANTKPPFEQGLRAEGADQRDVHQGGDDPPDTEAAGEERVNLTKQALRLCAPASRRVCLYRSAPRGALTNLIVCRSRGVASRASKQSVF